jgi:hypothetical protein
MINDVSILEVAFWSFAVFLASVFSGFLTGISLTPKYNGKIRALVWTCGAIFGYGITFLSYRINLYNDFVGIIGLSALVCIISQILYKDTWTTKLSVSLMACLIANVSTFMFCGTTDSLLAPTLGLIKEDPYEVPNLIFFIVVKLIVYSILSMLYIKFLKSYLHATIEAVGGKMIVFVPALVVSVLGFYIMNLLSNTLGIYPTNIWFFPLYLTICIIFVVEFWMIFYSINQSAKSIKNEAELNVATNIQQSMLPCIFPAFPYHAEFGIHASMNPAKEVGGDFYDFFMVDDRHLAIVVADVSGKGVPAALFMVIGKTLIKDHTQPDRNLGDVFTEVNKILCESNSEGLFITAFEGVLDLVTGEFNYVNAGHELPFLYRNGNFEVKKVRAGFVLAGMEDIHYRANSITLEPGDKIFQYTDGITEATNAKFELFGMDRLSESLNKCGNESPEKIISTVKADIDEFVGSAPQFDDITMLCLEYKERMKI